MLHCGDITKIDGHKVPIVDCVTFGAPCQDLSVAGKRAGMKHKDLCDEEATRSGLFMDAVRIIKEMREEDELRNGRSGVDVRPRYAVYENVPGAFSSNKGEDFRIVLEEIARIKDQDAVIPRPDKWQTSGCILGDGWSIAWRVLDAQFWGVPQRRRRIALVADFGGHSASEILFVSEGVCGNTQPSQPKGKTTSSDATRSIGADDCEPRLMDAYQHHGYRESDTCGTLTAGQNNSIRRDTPLVTAYTMKIRSGCDVDANGKAAGKGALIQTEKSGTISCVQDQYLFQPIGADQYNAVILGDSVSTLGVNCGMSHGRQCVLEPVVALDRASYNQGKNAKFDFEVNDGGIASTIVAKGPSAVCYSFDPLSSNSMKSANPHSGCHETNVARTIDTTYPDPSKNQGGVAVVEQVGAFYPQMKAESQCFRTDGISNCLVNGTNPGFQNAVTVRDSVRTRYTVRRLTPLECERLQGYPDGWTDIGEYIDSNGRKKQSSDAARYKALGNSIAIPPWKWVMKRLCACYERDATLASLFDGISGFPFIWTQLNGWGSVLWTSEIEEFPMAVCKKHFGDEATGERGDFYEAIL